MAVDLFEAHLKDPAPGFECFRDGSNKGEVAFVARVRHRVGRPATPKALAKFDALFGNSFGEIREFLCRHDGLRLYEDTQGNAAGILLYPILEWEARSVEMRQSFEAMGFDFALDTTGLLRGICIGEIPQSGNYFTLRKEPPGAGCVYYVDHDDWLDDPVAESFPAFLELIARDPAAFLYRRGCFARYFDRSSGNKWIPGRYVADAGSIPVPWWRRWF